MKRRCRALNWLISHGFKLDRLNFNIKSGPAPVQGEDWGLQGGEAAIGLDEEKHFLRQHTGRSSSWGGWRLKGLLRASLCGEVSGGAHPGACGRDMTHVWLSHPGADATRRYGPCSHLQGRLSPLPSVTSFPVLCFLLVQRKTPSCTGGMRSKEGKLVQGFRDVEAALEMVNSQLETTSLPSGDICLFSKLLGQDFG